MSETKNKERVHWKLRKGWCIVVLDDGLVRPAGLDREDYGTAVGPGRSRRGPCIGYREVIEGL